MTIQNISKEELKEKLEIIKDVLEKTKFQKGNIIFFNLKAFYSYLNKCYEKNIEKIMTQIEPFIPISLCIQKDTNVLEMLNTALFEKEIQIEQFKDLKNTFYDNSRMNFLNLIKNCDEDEWQKLLGACEELRKELES